MNETERQQALQELASQIEQHQLTSPARLMVDILAPVGILASQTALFMQPFLPHGRWRSYLAALTDEQGWEALQRILNSKEC
jgi:hypothetical protein